MGREEGVDRAWSGAGTRGSVVKKAMRTVITVAAIALVARLTLVDGLLAALVVGVVAAVVVAVGVRINLGHHDRSWARGWRWLVAAVSVHTVAGVVALGGAGGGYGGMAWLAVAVVGSGLVAAGGVALLRHRLSRGRAIDLLGEALVGSLGFAFLLWALVVDTGRVSTTVLALALALLVADLVALWLLLRLVTLTEEHPVAYRYAVGAQLAFAGVHGVGLGGVLGWEVVAAVPAALSLWGLCLFAAASLHPSLSERFAPVPPKPSSLGPVHVALVLLGVMLGPSVVAWRLVSGAQLPLAFLLGGTTGFPLVVIAHLVRQVQQRASGEYRAQHDELTGLPNRVLFGDRLKVALAHARRSGSKVGVLFLDLDQFKNVNDSLGHDVGNELLRAAGLRLRQLLREEDTVGRWGGDEFTVLLTDVDGSAGSAAVAEKILAGFAEPFEVGGRELFAGTSIGVAVFPDDGQDGDTLLKHADTAMYRAKARSRNTYQLYTSDMSVQAQVKLALEGGLRSALDRAELALHYQPRIDQRTARIVGMEALARWEHPSLGTIAPGAFIPLAEESGLIHRVGSWVLEAACAQAQEWRRQGLLDVPVSVNLSARQFTDADVEQQVVETLRATGLPPHLLELELTESVLLRDVDGVSESITRLRDLGVRCSIDDFGTGYSGLAYLARIPIDSLKIDRAFVAGIDATTTDAPIIDAVIALARSLHLNVVAEGVETADQVSFLRHRGCYEMQGFYFGEPLVAAALAQMARELEVERCRGRAAASLPALATSFATPADAAEVSDLLIAACQQGDLDLLRHRLDEVLAALAPVEPDQRLLLLPTHLPVRVAAGSFAGLVPLGSGLVAAGSLPDPAQDMAARILAEVGIDVPAEPLLPPLASVTGPDLLIGAPVVDRAPTTGGRSRDGGADAGAGAEPVVAEPELLPEVEAEPVADVALGEPRQLERPERPDRPEEVWSPRGPHRPGSDDEAHVPTPDGPAAPGAGGGRPGGGGTAGDDEGTSPGDDQPGDRDGDGDAGRGGDGGGDAGSDDAGGRPPGRGDAGGDAGGDTGGTPGGDTGGTPGGGNAGDAGTTPGAGHPGGSAGGNGGGSGGEAPGRGDAGGDAGAAPGGGGGQAQDDHADGARGRRNVRGRSGRADRAPGHDPDGAGGSEHAPGRTGEQPAPVGSDAGGR